MGLSKKTKRTKKSTAKAADMGAFYLAFVGEYVMLSGEFTTMDGSARVKSVGYLLDIDDEFYYLGETAGEVDVAIRKAQVHAVEVMKKSDPTRELLENMNVPDDETGVN